MLTPIEEPIDNLADLTESEWTNLKDWECGYSRCASAWTARADESMRTGSTAHFGTKYMLVGCVMLAGRRVSHATDHVLVQRLHRVAACYSMRMRLCDCKATIFSSGHQAINV